MFIPSRPVVVVVIGCDCYLARSQHCTRGDENKDGKRSRAANAVISFTMSWHVLASLSFLDRLLRVAFDPFVALPIPPHGTGERTLKALARLLGEEALNRASLMHSAGGCKQRFLLFATA
jgi:hypothetical protein